MPSETEAASAKPSQPDLDFSAYGEVEVVSLSNIQTLGGKRLIKAWNTIPHVTHQDEADVTDLETRLGAARRAEPALRTTALPYHVKAVVSALEAFPHFNASLDEKTGQLFLKKYFHIGVAIDTPRGLVVGVVRDCDVKSPLEIAQTVQALSRKARTRGLSYDEMAGGCFTISSLGGYGGKAFTPIINPPEVAILGVNRVHESPRRGENDAIEWRKVLPLSLSFDHRVLNGADAAKFMTHIVRALGDPVAVGLV
ncbi:2-oxo acid dehydrogenase subunit E2 [Phenylobacterium immobile]|uniref:2-oxo acid dehydrogenase subunit E2 n=1 Tax=Phenylobacterium immobile TaxID=21 RepID=UPI000A6A645C|nr:2-oxo acid dehydrogenase subunit E2 [Phenylobacterium immobile]